MKIPSTAFVVVSLFLVVFTSCKKNDDDACANALPTCSCAYIGIVDSEGNSLLGPNNVYEPSEISLTNKGQVIDLIQDDLGGEDIFLRFSLVDIISGQDYLLQLSSIETDIVNLVVTEQTDECFTTFTLQEFRLNGMEIEVEGEFILIEK